MIPREDWGTSGKIRGITTPQPETESYSNFPATLGPLTRNAFMYFGPRIFKNLGFEANLFQTHLGGNRYLRNTVDDDGRVKFRGA